MNALSAIAVLSGLYPVSVAAIANRRTTLRTALYWTGAAILSWGAAAYFPNSITAMYCALVLSACAGVAVLGARRPGVAAWNFVVGGLLAVLLLPVANGMGTPRLEAAHVIFLAAALAVVVLNYLPSRLGGPALLAGIAFGVELLRLAGFPVPQAALAGAIGSIVAAPWAGWLVLLRHREVAEVDRVWLDFRDRYGFLWAQRVREQFNRSATGTGSCFRLAWSRIRFDGHDTGEALTTMRALLKRFGTSADASPGSDQ